MDHIHGPRTRFPSMRLSLADHVAGQGLGAGRSSPEDADVGYSLREACKYEEEDQ